MRSTPAVLLILLFFFGLLSPPRVFGQDPSGSAAEQSQGDFRLEQNEPDPASPDTWIPFVLQKSLFERADSAVVSMQVFNLLAQQVAVPKAINVSGDDDPPLLRVVYRRPGRWLAYWDGKDRNGRVVPGGVYYLQLVVNGQPRLAKLIVRTPRRRRIPLIPWFGSK